MSSNFNKAWMAESDTTSDHYIEGIRQFLRFFQKNGGSTLYSCPCTICRNGKGMMDLQTITHHLFKKGIDPSYTLWHYHGENDAPLNDIRTTKSGGLNDTFDFAKMDDLVDDAFNMRQGGDVNSFPDPTARNDEGVQAGVHVDPPTDGHKSYKSLRDIAREPLYPSCPKGQTTLYAIVKLNNLKTQFNWSDNSVTALLELLKELFPSGNTWPAKYPDLKKVIKEIGMDYEVYDACLNDCILYRKEHADKLICPNCKTPRYKPPLKVGSKKKVPQKTLRHFPLIPRLKRLYSIPWIANAMTWHARAKSDSNIMRHPVDSSAWKCANLISSDFANEPRNVRLGISTDGFNPFGSLSSSYSCWPVIVVPYNLPPSMCMKREFSIVSLLISGPRAPSKDIDIYLEPLVDELKQLWVDGVMAFDSFGNTDFTLRAILLWGIHDFPAYGTLSGCATHGYMACPICAENTESEHLPHSKKICYMGHRKFLPRGNKFREDKVNFNKKVEHGTAPYPMTGSEIEERVSSLKMKIGKAVSKVSTSRKRKRVDDNSEPVVTNSTAWYRRSILFDLPYWKDLLDRHCLDVMHGEKNVAEHLIYTIAGHKGKSKDTMNARKDLEEVGIKPKLWLKKNAKSGKEEKPKATFELNKQENMWFFTILKNMKVPSMFSSNFHNNVCLQPLELKNFKTHDFHVIMQQLLPVLLQHAYPQHKDLRRALQRISIFFNILCSKVINRSHLLKAKASLIEAVCVLEKHFPYAFFDISIHTMVHLADEALRCGPVRYRWMYPFERLMKIFKGYVRNKRYIEGCIAEGYIVQEASLYCMEYMPDAHDGTHKHTREDFLDDVDECADEAPLDRGRHVQLTNVQFEQVRKWVLSKYDGLDEWEQKYDAHVKQISDTNPKGSTSKSKVETLVSFIRGELEKTNDMDGILWRLVVGPKFKVLSYTKYRANGFIFSTSEHEEGLVTQDSGVSMKAITQYRARVSDTNYKEVVTTYFGVIKQILELDYIEFKQTVFYCDWVKVEDKTNGCKIDPNTNLVLVNLQKMKSKLNEDDEPFILASEASQVFYSKDLVNDGWSVVVHTPKRLTTAVDDIEFPSIYQSAYEDNEKLEDLMQCEI